MVDIPSVEILLSFFIKTKCTSRSFGQLVKIVDNLSHAFLGFLVWLTVDELPVPFIIWPYSELQSLYEAVIHFSTYRAAY